MAKFLSHTVLAEMDSSVLLSVLPAAVLDKKAIMLVDTRWPEEQGERELGGQHWLTFNNKTFASFEKNNEL